MCRSWCEQACCIWSNTFEKLNTDTEDITGAVRWGRQVWRNSPRCASEIKVNPNSLYHSCGKTIRSKTDVCLSEITHHSRALRDSSDLFFRLNEQNEVQNETVICCLGETIAKSHKNTSQVWFEKIKTKFSFCQIGNSTTYMRILSAPSQKVTKSLVVLNTDLSIQWTADTKWRCATCQRLGVTSWREAYRTFPGTCVKFHGVILNHLETGRLT